MKPSNMVGGVAPNGPAPFAGGGARRRSRPDGASGAPTASKSPPARRSADRPRADGRAAVVWARCHKLGSVKIS